jgi:hypothetical protein
MRGHVVLLILSRLTFFVFGKSPENLLPLDEGFAYNLLKLVSALKYKFGRL